MGTDDRPGALLGRSPSDLGSLLPCGCNRRPSGRGDGWMGVRREEGCGGREAAVAEYSAVAEGGG